MMMTSGGGVHYKSMFDAGSQIIAKEGTRSLFKGAAANILRGVAGAGVLSMYDQLQVLMFGKVYSGGAFDCDIFRDSRSRSFIQALDKSFFATKPPNGTFVPRHSGSNRGKSVFQATDSDLSMCCGDWFLRYAHKAFIGSFHLPRRCLSFFPQYYPISRFPNRDVKLSHR
jgi:hypothetical protein